MTSQLTRAFSRFLAAFWQLSGSFLAAFRRFAGGMMAVFWVT